MRTLTRFTALGACVLLAACGAAEHTTAPNALGGRASRDLVVGPAQPPTYTGYTLTDISAGLPSSAVDINESGTIVGRHTLGGLDHGFIRHADGTLEDLPPLPGDLSNVASGVNASDVVVGSSTAANGTSHAWRKAPGGPMTPLGGLCTTGSHANAIGAAGEIVGDCSSQMAVWTSPQGPPLLRTLLFGTLHDVENGVAAGDETSPDGSRWAAVWDGHHVSPVVLPTGTTTSSWSTGVASAQQVVGAYTDATGDHGFVATLGGTTRLLPHPVEAMTALGRIVGWYVSIPAVAYTIAPNGLGVEVPLPPTTRDRVALRANRCGAIVGHYFPSGLQNGARAALWTKPGCD